MTEIEQALKTVGEFLVDELPGDWQLVSRILAKAYREQQAELKLCQGFLEEEKSQNDKAIARIEELNAEVNRMDQTISERNARIVALEIALKQIAFYVNVPGTDNPEMKIREILDQTISGGSHE